MGTTPDQYKELIAGDPGTDLDDAFTSMAAEEVKEPVPEGTKMSMADISRYLGREVGRRVYAELQAAVGLGAMDDWELEELIDTGFEITDSVLRGAIQALGDGGLLTDHAELLELNETTVKKYPFLVSQQQLQNARDISAKLAADKLKR